MIECTDSSALSRVSNSGSAVKIGGVTGGGPERSQESRRTCVYI